MQPASFIIFMRWYQVKKYWMWIVVIIVLTTFLSVSVFNARLFFSVAQKFQDGFSVTNVSSDSDIFIVKIDDKSLQELGVFPWPRGLHANMIQLLDAVKPKVIGYDVSFPNRSASSEQDALLSTALQNVQTPVVLAQELRKFTDEKGQIVAQINDVPLASFLGKNVRTGFINVFPDQDIFVRHFPPSVVYNDSRIASFAEKVVSVINPDAAKNIPASDGFFPVYNLNRYPSFSFSDILQGKISPEIFKGKTVLVGSTAADLHDEVNVPNQDNKVPGVFLHALYIDSILSNQFFYEVSSGSSLFLLLLVIALVFAAKIFFRASVDWIMSFILLILIVALPFLLVQRSLLVPLFYFAMAWLLAVIFGSVLKILLVEREREQIKNYFELYVNKAVADELIRNPERAVLGGDKREMTVLFSDIRGFTSLSEQMLPQEVVKFLNEYLNMMTEVVLANGGVLDKYIGDAIMAFWGAPLPQQDHAVRAVRTAWHMQKTLKEQGQDILRDWPDFTQLKIGIGLNSGLMSVGNMGSKLRFDYTVIGDNVNIASRVEGLTKYWNADILITEATKKLVQDHFHCRELDLVRVKGRNEPLRLFDIWGEKNGNHVDVQAQLLLFQDALHYYRSGQFTEATQKFSIWKERVPDDKVVDVFIKRCQEFLADPEKAKHWDGIITMETK